MRGTTPVTCVAKDSNSRTTSPSIGIYYYMFYSIYYYMFYSIYYYMFYSIYYYMFYSIYYYITICSTLYITICSALYITICSALYIIICSTIYYYTLYITTLIYYYTDILLYFILLCRDIVHLGKPSYRERKRIALQQSAAEALGSLNAADIAYSGQTTYVSSTSPFCLGCQSQDNVLSSRRWLSLSSHLPFRLWSMRMGQQLYWTSRLCSRLERQKRRSM